MKLTLSKNKQKEIHSGDLLIFGNDVWALYIEPDDNRIAPLLVFINENEYELICDQIQDQDGNILLHCESNIMYEVERIVPKSKLELREI